MRHVLRLTGYLAGIAVLATGCGRKQEPEMPEPATEYSSPASSPASRPTTAAPTDHGPVAPPEPAVDTRRATLEERIHFGFDRSDISPEARGTLAMKGEILRTAPGITLRIEGHADERGSDEYNLALSNRRAAEAKRFLVQQGVAADRLEVVGYGEEQPLDGGQGESAWAMNRRAEFRVTGGDVSQR